MYKEYMMIKNIYNNLINANLNLPPDSLEFKKVRIINFILYISVIVNLLVIGENFKAGQIVSFVVKMSRSRKIRSYLM